jgi:hypothetical protein
VDIALAIEKQIPRYVERLLKAPHVRATARPAHEGDGVSALASKANSGLVVQSSRR